MSALFSFRYAYPLLIGLLSMAPVRSTLGAPPGEELETLRRGYQLRLAELDADLNALTANYTRHLQGLLPAQQAKGNLEAILALKEEINRPGQSKLKTAFPELQQAQKLYLSNRERLTLIRTEKVTSLAGIYRRSLEDLVVTLTQAGRIDEAIAAKEEIELLGTKAEVPKASPGPLTTPEKNRVLWLLEAKTAAQKAGDEKVQDKLWRDLARAFANCGEDAQSDFAAKRISNPAIRGEAAVAVSTVQAARGAFDKAIVTARSAPETWDTDRALVEIAKIQLSGGLEASAQKTSSLIKGKAGSALHAVIQANVLRQKGDSAGYNKKMAEAIATAQGLTVEAEMEGVFRTIAVAQVKAGDAAGAKHTATLYHGPKFGTPLIAIIGAQAEMGDFRGANETFGGAGFSKHPACLAGTLIADAQAARGDFAGANRTAQGLSYAGPRMKAVAAVATKKGDLAAARQAAAALLSSEEEEGNHSDAYARALAPTVALQAKLEGTEAALKYARSLKDPVAQCLGLIALAEAGL